MATGFVVPTFFGIKISDVDLHFHQGYTSAGFDITAAHWIIFQKLWYSNQSEEINIFGLKNSSENKNYYPKLVII